ncbi:MAG: hypothetical protein II161_03330 [Erysipelotrichaceae bacterium]|nr:hypothetical protein [Erysipelotrichaceae bacterium]
MKGSKLKVILAVLMVLTALPLTFSTVKASDDVPISEDIFPDPNFRKYVHNKLDKNHDNVLSSQEIEAVTNIQCNAQDIGSLEGIQVFHNVNYLECNDNYIKEFNVNKLPNLEYLEIKGNDLTKIDISRHKKLISVEAENNRLTSFKIGSNKVIQSINVNLNSIASLDVSGASNLSVLRAQNNKYLEYVDVSGNKLKKLDVTKQTNLNYLYCNHNKLTSLNVTKNTLLYDLGFTNNKIKYINLRRNGVLERLETYYNDLAKINIGKSFKLVELTEKYSMKSYDLEEVWTIEDENEEQYLRFDSATIVYVDSAEVPIVYSIKRSGTSAKLTWERIPGAAGYEIERSNDPDYGYVKIATVKKETTLKYTDKKLAAGKKYFYRVRAYFTDESPTEYTDYSGIDFYGYLKKNVSPTVKSVNYQAARISWKAVAGADVYNVYRATSKKGPYTLIKETSALEYIDTGLTLGKTYYYKVSGVLRYVDGYDVYTCESGMSSAKSVKTVINVPVINNIYLNSSDNVVIEFDEPYGATAYKIYRSTRKSSGFKEIATVAGGSGQYIDTTAVIGKTYYYKMKVVELNGLPNTSKYSAVRKFKAVH